MDDKRSTGLFWAALCGLMLLSVLVLLIFLPFARCPGCDNETWRKTYPNSIGSDFQLSRSAGSECVRCNSMGRMSFYRRWQLVREWHRIGITEVPFFP